MKEIALLVVGFVVWSAAFLVIYAVQATGCAMQAPSGVLRGTLIAVLAAFLLAEVGVLMMAARNAKRPLGRSALLASVAALVASALTFSGVFLFRLC